MVWSSSRHALPASPEMRLLIRLHSVRKGFFVHAKSSERERREERTIPHGHALEVSIESSNFIRCKSPPTPDDASRAREPVFMYIRVPTHATTWIRAVAHHAASGSMVHTALLRQRSVPPRISAINYFAPSTVFLSKFVTWRSRETATARPRWRMYYTNRLQQPSIERNGRSSHSGHQTCANYIKPS